MELGQDIIGTNPQQPSIIDHDWLTVDADTYDNYPSDNNPVRILPKLSDMWNRDKNTGLNLIPNQTVQPMCCVQADTLTTSDVVREAKKAMMSGLKQKALTNHLRSRFSSNQLLQAKEELQKLSSEQGLLGNVYIDASAFSSAKEAEQFMAQNRTRLARDIVVNAHNVLNEAVINLIASKFHKNVVAEVVYNDQLFESYKNHLVASRRIASNFVIDSKESLRTAFLADPQVQAEQIEKEKLIIPQEKVQKELQEGAEKRAVLEKRAETELEFKTIYPLVEFTRKHFASKDLLDLKQELRNKYSLAEIKKAAKYLALVVSDERLAAEASELPDYVAGQLTQLAKKFPIKEKESVEEPQKTANFSQYQLYALSGKQAVSNENQKIAFEGLMKGDSIDSIQKNLEIKLGSEAAAEILSQAMAEFNSVSAGVRANVFKPAAKQKLVPDIEEKQTLPDLSTIPGKTKEVLSYFEGSNNDIPVDDAISLKNIDISGLFNREGLDRTI